MFQQPGGMQWQILHMFDHFSPITEGKSYISITENDSSYLSSMLRDSQQNKYSTLLGIT